MDQGVVGVKHVIGCLIAFAVLLAPARVLAGGYGSYSQLTGFISSLIRGSGGVGREMIRPPAPPPLRGPDPIFGLVESPKRLWRYAQQGFGRQVLEGLRRGRYRDLAGTGQQYSELRLQVRQLLLEGKASLPSRTLRVLAEDSETSGELAKVLNYILSRRLQWRDLEADQVLKWAQGRLRYLRAREEPKEQKRQRQDPPAPPPPVTAAPAPRPAPPPKPPTSLRRSTTWAWIASAAAGVAAVARTIASSPLRMLVP